MTKTKRTSAIDEWRKTHATSLKEYYSGTSYVPSLPPQVAVQLPGFDTLDKLYNKLGSKVIKECLNPNFNFPSPAVSESNPSWIKKSNIVGVNIRTIENFFNLVKYTLSLSDAQDCLHILPIWEPGVVNSLYGKISWNINTEFFSEELKRVQPHLDTVEKQLKVCINFIHALGKTIGMDVIPHCDRFSEIVLSNPSFFEWVKIKDAAIVTHNGHLDQEVENIIFQYLQKTGTANDSPIPNNATELFKGKISEEDRNELLFGYQWDTQKREKRRIEIMLAIINEGLETLPVTMAPPYRGLHIEKDSFEIDKFGNKWYEFKFDTPQEMSRVFGPLTRYKFHDTKENSWELDFDKPCRDVWEYFSSKYAACQAKYNFDYMRGDMAHVQPRPQGVPKNIDSFYDPLLFTKLQIQNNQAPHFAFFAETFLVPDNYMSYGSEIEHLNAIEADATLGDLQSSVFGSKEFKNKLRDYIEWNKTESFAPTLTIITSDKDDPRFDKFYRTGNLARIFLGYFMTDMPSYFSLGHETRALNLKRNLNETYSKLFVFTIKNKEEKDKVTSGPYIWGENWNQFNDIQILKNQFETVLPFIKGQETEVLEFSDHLVWTQKSKANFLFSLSFKENSQWDQKKLKGLFPKSELDLVYAHTEKFECLIFKFR